MSTDKMFPATGPSSQTPAPTGTKVGVLEPPLKEEENGSVLTEGLLLILWQSGTKFKLDRRVVKLQFAGVHGNPYIQYTRIDLFIRLAQHYYFITPKGRRLRTNGAV